MAVNMHIIGAAKPHAPTPSNSLVRNASDLLSRIGRFAGAALGKVHTAVNTLQSARMMSTLSNMSDYQLDQIGISRSDIPKYAETLMAKE